MINIKKKIAIIGVGYVGLPLLISLSKYFNCIGYDIDKKKIKQLNKQIDDTRTFKQKDLKKVKFTSNLKNIKNFNHFIITVPTPVNEKNKPNLNFLKDACKAISKIIKKNDMIIFESTYAPFTTKNICLKIINKNSKIKSNEFYYGYSPERINPGDKSKDLKKLTKIISSETEVGIDKMKDIYSKICKKIYIVNKIEVAEAAKIIENIQRDINIAYFNNLTQIFTQLKINPLEIFRAASTKWNFINMKPGLVGGHCIPVDPYYFQHLLKQKKIKSNFLISGRNINENFKYVIIKKIEELIKKKFLNQKFNIIFLGLTYKPNVPDFRNSKALEIFNYFKKKMKKMVYAYDPYLKNIRPEYLSEEKFIEKKKQTNLIIKLVDHSHFKKNQFKKVINFNSLISNL